MEPRDCTWCGSARSVEHDVCQVCLMRFPELKNADEVVVILDERELQIHSVPAEEEEAARTAVSE
ncbi:MAG TPA: hypothetical protein VF097_03400 [Actinomycetota bacterium]